jgi:hypothetical protein
MLAEVDRVTKLKLEADCRTIECVWIEITLRISYKTVVIWNCLVVVFLGVVPVLADNDRRSKAAQIVIELHEKDAVRFLLIELQLFLIKFVKLKFFKLFQILVAVFLYTSCTHAVSQLH